MAKINFFEEDISYTLKHKLKLKQWITATILAEGYALQELNFIFCSDAYLLEMNQQFLQHDTYTDIITFDHSEKENQIAGDIFISIERVKENAQTFKISTFDELCRIIIHGVLHLLGYGDKSKAEKSLMTEKENAYLQLRNI